MRHCGDPPHHRRITTIARDPDGETTGYSDQTTFYLPDLEGDDRIGSLDPTDWVTYFHVYPSQYGGVMIQYWHTFAYNDFGGVWDDHGGDWDASIQVELLHDLNLDGVWFSRHANDHPGIFFPATRVRLFEGTHPVIAIDGGGHAAYRSPGDWATCHCTVGSGITGPIGSIVWTRDSDPFDDPSSLRRVIHICGPLGCDPFLGEDASGGTVWKTWTGGDVRQAGVVEHAIVQNPSPHGALLNMGEYNPCTPVTCQGTRQASTLLAGQFVPLNDQIWIQYEGRWGSIGHINSGPRGPVFQGFDNDVYTSWYNNGANSPADASTSPWREPPSTSLNVGSPSYLAVNGATYVTGTTPLTLTATQSAIAMQYGSISTFYRFFPVSNTAGPYAIYSTPFTVSGADGTYAVNYYSLDALNNEEGVQAQVLTLDNTPPVVDIRAPVAAQYAHSGTLTLDYAVTDTPGSDVQQFTPRIDGLAMLASHGLQSGQVINLLTELSVGTHTFAVDAADNLGNSGGQSVTFEIIVTADSIKDDVTYFASTGMIKKHGLAKSLMAKLNAAAHARARGNCGTAAHKYRAFIHELLAQSGKGIDAAAAQIMIADAQYLIAHCP